MYNRAPFGALFELILWRYRYMETRVALIGIIVENRESTGKLNTILHEYADYIIGRMGLPYREKGINIISIAVDAPNDIISAMSGKIGRLPGVSAKAAYSKVSSAEIRSSEGED
jgi:putative iron-only hydrogenase system regulator